MSVTSLSDPKPDLIVIAGALTWYKTKIGCIALSRFKAMEVACFYYERQCSMLTDPFEAYELVYLLAVVINLTELLDLSIQTFDLFLELPVSEKIFVEGILQISSEF